MKGRKFWKYFYSLRFLIFLLALLTGIVPVAILETVMIENVEETLISTKEAQLRNQTYILASQLVSAGYLIAQTDNLNAEIRQMATDNDGRIMIVDASLMVIMDTMEVNVGRFILDPDVLMAFESGTRFHNDKENACLDLIMPLQSSSGAQTIGVVILSAGTEGIRTQMRQMSNRMAILVGILVLISLLLAIAVAHLVAKPFKSLKESVDAVSAGEAQAIGQQGYSELVGIINSFNNMLSQLHTLDESRQEFVSNVSHELKTPITSIRVLADSLMTMEDAPIELYKEFMQDISNEIDRESKIITDLLDLVKMDKTAAKLNIASVDVNEMLNSILHRLLPIAGQRNIELVMESFRPVVAQIDETKLSLALSNLVENAIKYNVDNGFVHVSLNADHKYMYIKIQDSGVGIPEDCLEFIFDRFYRVDKARSRETGGTGLGLAITKSVIQMHKGAIRVYSKVNDGTTFSVRVPLKFIE